MIGDRGPGLIGKSLGIARCEECGQWTVMPVTHFNVQDDKGGSPEILQCTNSECGKKYKRLN